MLNKYIKPTFFFVYHDDTTVPRRIFPSYIFFRFFYFIPFFFWFSLSLSLSLSLLSFDSAFSLFSSSLSLSLSLSLHPFFLSSIVISSIHPPSFPSFLPSSHFLTFFFRSFLSASSFISLFPLSLSLSLSLSPFLLSFFSFVLSCLLPV